MHSVRAVCAAAIICGWASHGWAQETPIQGGVVLSMEDAIDRALNAAPSIPASEAAIQAAGGSLLQARARPNPELSMEFEDFAGSGMFNGVDQAEVTLGVGQTFERGGKRRARIGLAQADRKMARISAAIARSDIVYAARRAYVEAMAGAASVESAARRLQTAQELETVVTRRVEGARDPAAARERAASRRLEAETDLAQAGFAFDLAKQRLAAMWGSRETGFTIDRRAFFSITAAGSPVTPAHLDRNPELLHASAVQDRASAALRLEHANAKQDPTVGLGLRYFQQSDDVAAMVSFSMPLAFFDTNRGNIARAAAERQRSEWLALDARMRLDRQLTTNLHRLRAARAEVLALRNSIIPKADEALNGTRDGYVRGAFTYLEVLEAQKALQQFQAREIAALTRLHLADAAISRLLVTYEGPATGQELDYE